MFDAGFMSLYYRMIPHGTNLALPGGQCDLVVAVEHFTTAVYHILHLFYKPVV